MGARILLAGVGSVGGVLAGTLLAAGHDVTLLTANPAITAAIRAHGLVLETPAGRHQARAAVFTTERELPPDFRCDWLMLAMMAGAVEQAARDCLPLLCATGHVVTFQNGMVGERVAALAGAARTLVASVAFGAQMLAPGEYRRTSGGELFIGQPGADSTPPLVALKALLDHVVPTTISANISGVLWAKLAWNCAVSGLCAVAGLTLGELVARADGRGLFLRAYREALDIARARGVTLEQVVIDHRRFYLPRAADAATRAACDAAVAALAVPYGAVRPSALQSLERGRRTEIGFLNGYLAAEAEACAAPAPLNARLAAMVADIEAGRRGITQDNLAALAPLLAADA